MVKAGAFFFAALCILAFAALVNCTPEAFNLDGNVYCDPCRVEFKTELSTPISGATVRLECRNAETRKIVYSVEGVTDKSGHYTMKAEGDHGEEICEVFAVKSSRSDCSEPFGNFERSRVVLSENSGIKGTDRFINPLGFKTPKPADKCQAILAELGLASLDIMRN